MELHTPRTLESSTSVLLVHAADTEPNAQRGVEDVDGDWTELTVAFPGQHEPRRAVDAPANRAIVSVGDVLESPDGRLSDDAAPVVDAITDPTDLPAVGISVSRFCDRRGDAEPLVVSVRSLDRFLQYAPPPTVFRFVHALVARLEQVGATVYAYFDRSRHDDRLVSTFGTLFDEVVVEGPADPLPEATDEEIARRLGSRDERHAQH